MLTTQSVVQQALAARQIVWVRQEGRSYHTTSRLINTFAKQLLKVPIVGSPSWNWMWKSQKPFY